MASLPRSFDLTEPLNALPDNATQTLVTIRPDNNTSFTPQQIITLSLGQRGFLDPKSLSIRYRVVVNNGGATTTAAVAMIGVPVFTPFVRMNEYCGGATISSVNAFNQSCQAIVSGSYSVSSKYGLQNCFGYGGSVLGTYPPPTTDAGLNPAMDGRQIKIYNAAAAEPLDNFYVSAPLLCSMIGSAEKMIPLFAMPQLRIELTLDALANMFYSSAGTGANQYITPSSFTISNFELCYSMIDMGAEIERYTLSSAPQLKIKSKGYNNSAVSVAVGAVGASSLVFNQRFSSIKSAFVLPASTSLNKWGDFMDITNGGGDYQLVIGNVSYPQAPLSTTLNRSGILQETRRAFGCLFDSDNNNSINAVEFAQNINYTDTVGVSSTTPYEPGKFIVGVDLDKVAWGDRTLMSGVSTFGTSISVNVNLGSVATTKACNVGLLLAYDAILVIDTATKQMSVRS
jgi:hypothetical protein